MTIDIIARRHAGRISSYRKNAVGAATIKFHDDLSAKAAIEVMVEIMQARPDEVLLSNPYTVNLWWKS